jgi:NAD(P)H-dependent FMN reductase
VSASPSNGIEALGIAGSLRQGSYDRALLRAAQDLAPDGLDIAVFHNETLNRIPPRTTKTCGLEAIQSR